MPATKTYTLVLPAPAPVVPAVAAASNPAPTAAPAVKVGVLRPLRFGPDGNPVTGSGDALRSAKIERVITTRSSGAKFSGEVPWAMGYGSQFELLRQTNVTDVWAPLATLYGQDALASALPDEVVESVTVIDDADTESVEVIFVTRSRATRGARPRPLETKVRSQ